MVDLKVNITSCPEEHPAWRAMVVDRGPHRPGLRCRYLRRAAVEVVFEEFKARLG